MNQLFKEQEYDSGSFFLIAGPCVVESQELIEEWRKKFIHLQKAFYSLTS
jgi:3-deoxy-D-manno-octulosonic acid (KDO) 8-phosphate synthase